MRRPATASLIAAVALLFGGCASSGVAPSTDVSYPTATPASEAAPQSMLFLTTSSTDSPHRAVLTFDFAVIAREKGYDVSVFLAGDATLLMKENVRSEIRAPGQPPAAELMKKAGSLGIPIYV